MNGGLHYMLQCSGCENPIAIPQEMLEQVAPLLKAQANGTEIVAVECARCKRARNFDLAKTNPSPTSHLWEVSQQTSGWVYLGTLECEDPTCTTPLPLFGRANFRPTKTTADGLTCPNGHPIPALE